MAITPWVVYWAAEECSLQGSGELSVAWMVDGWRYAHRYRNQPITLTHVLALGKIVERRTNLNGLRQVNVRVGYDVKMDWSLVGDALVRLLAAQPRLRRAEAGETTPAEWFREYEEIHPFRDGNGRTGSIFYNWLCGSLPVPVPPPNFWGDPRR